MIDLKAFIPAEIAIAPSHPLVKNLELRLPDYPPADIAEIWAIQRRDRIPGVVKRIIPLDNTTFWEYWWCVPGRLILPEDAELLQRDLPRIEAILSRLIWLWGGNCFGNETSWDEDTESIHDWQQVIAFVEKQGLKPDVLDIDFLPIAIQMDDRHSESVLVDPTTPNHVAVEPAHWHIEFFQLQPTDGGYKLQEPKNVCSCQLWTAKPFIKDLKTGEAMTRYDLWLSRPLDLTNPPWQPSLF